MTTRYPRPATFGLHVMPALAAHRGSTMAARPYRGKHPDRVRAVFGLRNGAALVELNCGIKFCTTAHLWGDTRGPQLGKGIPA